MYFSSSFSFTVNFLPLQRTKWIGPLKFVLTSMCTIKFTALSAFNKHASTSRPICQWHLFTTTFTISNQFRPHYVRNQPSPQSLRITPRRNPRRRRWLVRVVVSQPQQRVPICKTQIQTPSCHDHPLQGEVSGLGSTRGLPTTAKNQEMIILIDGRWKKNKNIAQQQRSKGHEVKIGYKKITIYRVMYKWNKTRNGIVKAEGIKNWLGTTKRREKTKKCRWQGTVALKRIRRRKEDKNN